MYQPKDHYKVRYYVLRGIGLSIDKDKDFLSMRETSESCFEMRDFVVRTYFNEVMPSWNNTRDFVGNKLDFLLEIR